MKVNNNLDQKIQEAFRLQEEGLEVSDALKERIDEQIYQEDVFGVKIHKDSIVREVPEIRSMKQKGGNHMKITMKKVGVGIAVACLMVSGMVFAGEIKGWRSHLSLLDPTYGSYEQMAEAETKFGHTVDSVDEFDNGYKFEEARISKMDAFDESGHTVTTVDQLWIDYSKDGGKDLCLVIEADKGVNGGQPKKAPDATKEIDGVTVRFDIYTYKLVPADYELTPEDEVNLKRDDYEISYGLDRVEIRQNESLLWEKDGIIYNLFGWNTSMTSEDFFRMAEELITAE